MPVRFAADFSDSVESAADRDFGNLFSKPR